MKNRLIVLVLGLFVGAAFSGICADEGDKVKAPDAPRPEKKVPEKTEPKEGEEAPRRRPLVVLKQTEIEGRVFFIGVGKKRDEVAVKLKVNVQREDNDEVIFKTRTDKAGRYTLPNMETGKYRLNVGKLKLDLEVMEPEQGSNPSKSIPKKLLVFIPRELR